MEKSFINFNQCDIITPNLNELKQLSGNNIISEEDIKESCKIILKKYNNYYFDKSNPLVSDKKYDDL